MKKPAGDFTDRFQFEMTLGGLPAQVEVERVVAYPWFILAQWVRVMVPGQGQFTVNDLQPAQRAAVLGALEEEEMRLHEERSIQD